MNLEEFKHFWRDLNETWQKPNNPSLWKHAYQKSFNTLILGHKVDWRSKSVSAHQPRVSVFPNILFLQFSKHKVTNPCKFSNFLSSSWPVEGLCSRIASIHVPPLSSLKQNKTYERGTLHLLGWKEHHKEFESEQSASCTHAVIDTSTHSRAPCQCMTDVYLLYFLGQLEAEHMLWATSISEKPK